MALSPFHPIALLTDFGDHDGFVAAMKGEILGRLSHACLVDISHQVPPQSVRAGQFVLESVIDSMPEGTVFCCVVDPGVGSARRALCGRIGRWFWSGPDNGLATPLLERAAADFDLHQIQDPQWQTGRVSSTFHGRDLFAPAAARLADGWSPERAGEAVSDPILQPEPRPISAGPGVTCEVVWVDRFGNLITTLKRDPWEEALRSGQLSIYAGQLSIRSLSEYFWQVPPGAALAYWGSSGRLEIGVNGGSAAQASELTIGDSISIDWVGLPGRHA